MGVMDNNMVHTESSKLSNGGNNVLSDDKNGVTNPMTRLNFKRRNVYAVRDFPAGCGSIAMSLRSRTQVKNSQNNGDVSEAATKVESLAKEEEMLVQRVERNCSSSNDMDVVVTVSAEPELMKDESMSRQRDKGICSNGRDVDVTVCVEPEPMKEEAMTVSPEDMNRNIGEPVEVQPLSVCLPEDNEDIVRASSPLKDGGRSIVKTKQPHRRKVSVVREFPSQMRIKCSDSEKVVGSSTGKNSALEKPSSGVSITQNTVKEVVVYGENDLDRSLALTNEVSEQSSKDPIPIHGGSRKKAKKGLAFHSPVKISREYGEGSRTKNDDKNLYKKARVSSGSKDSQTTLQVMIPPSRPSGSGGGESIRNKVKETLRLFHGACRKLLQELEANPPRKGTRKPRIDFEASKILKAKGKYLNTNQIMGHVPGVEVGDEFQYRMELNILGIHRPSQAGIDYMKIGEDIFATSIVASGGYDDELDNSDVLTYTGQGGNVMKMNKKGQEEKEPEDQQLLKGNLALANSVSKINPVRVIRGNKKAALEGDARGGNYVYDGLYVVEDFWQETGSHGKLVFRFKLRRMPGQPELSWKVVKKSTSLKYRQGLCKLDISEGRERLPISAINEIDDEKPPMFTYMVKMIYPNWCKPIPHKTCGCTTRCTETRNCLCVAKNGGEIPYNYSGAIVSAKPLIYECGPLCKCPASCYLKVTQRGIKFQLEIFKTESRGWGVRSLNSIPSGSFICEYVGELLDDKEAEQRTGSDEYLFDIGNKYDTTLSEGMSKLMPETRIDEEEDHEEETSSGFTIDAAKKGNIGRFINHSCSPNLYAQNVLYDHEDARIPHVMFFAMDNIPPLQELCYHYNYMLDQVRDSNGNIKKKNCYCGSSECTGRLY
ncbi:unnamed protein product [Cochlearia groenlandica]